MSHIYVRPMRDEDREGFVRAVSDPTIFLDGMLPLPTTRIMVAEKFTAGQPRVVLYQPMYLSLVMGSYVGLGSDTEIASALHQMTAHAYTRSNGEGFADVLAFTDTGVTEGFAARHQFEPTHGAYRLRVR